MLTTKVHANGAGIYNNGCSPVIEWCGFRKNYAIGNGGGIFDKGGIKSIKFCLLQNNITKRGNGSGIFSADCSKLNIMATIFDRNALLDTCSGSGGSLSTKSSNIEIVNSIFTKNTSNSYGGALFIDSSSAKILNCTFSDNLSLRPGCSVTIKGSSTCNINNSILWNSRADMELYGIGFIVEYSCVKNGYAGTGNISTDPMFNDATLPEGTDGLFGSSDDGLRLEKNSPCIDILKGIAVPEIDILLLKRPWGAGSDMGAYEYEEYAQSTDNFGYLRRDGVFVPRSEIDIIDVNYHWKYIRLFSKSDYARDFRLLIPKNEYTERKNEMYLLARGIRANGSIMTDYPEVRIELYKVDEDANSLLFQSRTSSNGKRILFVNSDEYHNWPNLWAYVIYTEKGLNITVPHSQFR